MSGDLRAVPEPGDEPEAESSVAAAFRRFRAIQDEPTPAGDLPAELGLVMARNPGLTFGQTWHANSGPGAGYWWATLDGRRFAAGSPGGLLDKLRAAGVIAHS